MLRERQSSRPRQEDEAFSGKSREGDSSLANRRAVLQYSRDSYQESELIIKSKMRERFAYLLFTMTFHRLYKLYFAGSAIEL